MARLARFERATLGFGGRYSIQLSYRRILDAHNTSLAYGSLWRQNPLTSPAIVIDYMQAASPKIWLLYLALPGRFGLIFTGVLIFVAMAVAFLAVGDMRTLYTSGALFFCAMCAYIVPVFCYINRISVRAVDALRAVLDMPEAEFLEFRQSISQQSLGWNLFVTAWGLAGGFFHLALIDSGRGTSFIEEVSSSVDFISDIGALLVWLVMTVTIWSLVQNAIRIGRLGHRLLPINLFRTEQLVPFAWVAISSCLSLIGSLALFPLLFIDRDTSLLTVLPGIIPIFIPMLAMLLLPMWPAHKLLKARKSEEIRLINASLDDLRSEEELYPDRERLQAINSLLDHRAHLQNVSDWPIDVGSISRLAFYLIIPPLTWVGAALIENLVDVIL